MLYNVLIGMFFPITGIIFYSLGKKFANGIKNKNIIRFIFLLILIDQCIKIYFNNYINKYSVNKINIYTNKLYPMKNTLASSINSFFNMKIDSSKLIILNIIFIIIVCYIYKVHITKYTKNLWNDFFIIFIESGLICSLIDKIFWKGSIDFINFNNLILFDFKDVYLVLSLILLVCEVFLNEKINILYKE